MENFNQQNMSVPMNNGVNGYNGQNVQTPVSFSGQQGMMNQCDDTCKPLNCDEAMNITSLHELQQYSKGSLIRFPDFDEGMPFVARVKRPSMLALAKSGSIPNSLLESANALFQKGGDGADIDNPKMLEEMYDVMEIICRSALISPSFDEIKNAGLQLTDEQMMAIFSYTQVGVKALQSFRKE